MKQQGTRFLVSLSAFETERQTTQTTAPVNITKLISMQYFLKFFKPKIYLWWTSHQKNCLVTESTEHSLFSMVCEIQMSCCVNCGLNQRLATHRDVFVASNLIVTCQVFAKGFSCQPCSIAEHFIDLSQPLKLLIEHGYHSFSWTVWCALQNGATHSLSLKVVRHFCLAHGLYGHLRKSVSNIDRLGSSAAQAIFVHWKIKLETRSSIAGKMAKLNNIISKLQRPRFNCNF